MNKFLLSSRCLIFIVLAAVDASLCLASSGGGESGSPYFEIGTPFVVNLAGQDSLSYLQVNAQFKIKKPELKTQLQIHMPAIQHTMMMLLSEQTVSSIRSVQGKQTLRETALKKLQQLFQAQIGDPVIDEIYFTGFVIQ